jgi:hypothetical protein
MHNSLRALPHNERVLRAVNRLRRRIDQANTTNLEGEALREFLDDFQLQLAHVHEHVNKIYFA